MNEINFFFYSNNCSHSNKLRNLLIEKNLINKFKIISVDNNKNIPNNIKKVPTLIIKDINIPLEGNAAFNWVNTVSKFYQSTNNINESKKIENKIIIKKDKFKGLNNNDTKSISDNYAFIEDKEIIKNNISYINDKTDKKIKKSDEKNPNLNPNLNINLKKYIKSRQKQIIDFSKLNIK